MSLFLVSNYACHKYIESVIESKPSLPSLKLTSICFVSTFGFLSLEIFTLYKKLTFYLGCSLIFSKTITTPLLVSGNNLDGYFIYQTISNSIFILLCLIKVKIPIVGSGGINITAKEVFKAIVLRMLTYPIEIMIKTSLPITLGLKAVSIFDITNRVTSLLRIIIVDQLFINMIKQRDKFNTVLKLQSAAKLILFVQIVLFMALNAYLPVVNNYYNIIALSLFVLCNSTFSTIAVVIFKSKCIIYFQIFALITAGISYHFSTQHLIMVYLTATLIHSYGQLKKWYYGF
ncbi:hypothetical protein N8668_00805 [bacterium]|nr:hypothetical protein [bacterium]